MARNVAVRLLLLAYCWTLASGNPGLSLCPSCRPAEDTPAVPESVTIPPSKPTITTDTPDGYTSESTTRRTGGGGIDFLVAAFFLIAAGWLVLALVYSVLVLLVLRLRARGQLDVYDEAFGRFYLFGSTRCYIPLGCVLRRYVVAMNRQEQPVRLMTREERRAAMELLLLNTTTDNDTGASSKSEMISSNEDNNVVAASVENSHVDDPDDSSSEEPVCTICLGEYESADVCFTSSVCSHRYHRACIMEWLERRANTECPCCRTPLVSDEEVWTTVQNMRQEHRRQYRKSPKSYCCCFKRQQEEETVPSSPQTLSPATTAGSDDDSISIEAGQTPDLERGHGVNTAQ